MIVWVVLWYGEMVDDSLRLEIRQGVSIRESISLCTIRRFLDELSLFPKSPTCPLLIPAPGKPIKDPDYEVSNSC